MMAPPSTLLAIAIKRFWVLKCIREKKKIGKTCLFRYYKRDKYVRPHKIMVTVNRNKVRRFEHRSRDAYNATIKKNRICNDMVFEQTRWTCDNVEERNSKPHSGSQANKEEGLQALHES
ncbi:hypothetical protein R6Q59_009728 [Mikania micrantha]